MNDSEDFETWFQAAVHDETRHIVADESMQQHLIGGATKGPSTGSARTPVRRLRRPVRTSWLIPAAAAVATLLTIGAIFASATLGRSPVGGTGNTLADSPTPTVTTSFSDSPSDSPTQSLSATPSTSPSRDATTAQDTATSTDTTSDSSTSPEPPPSTSAPALPSPNPTSAYPEFYPHLPQSNAPAACHEANSGAYKPTTLAEFKTRVEGTWLACTYPTEFDTGEAGMIIRPDGTWAKLIYDANGRLQAMTGHRNSGTWTTDDNTAMNLGKPSFQINLIIDAHSEYSPYSITFYTGKMHMVDMGTLDTMYVATSGPVT